MAAGQMARKHSNIGYGTASDLAVQAVYKETGAKGGWSGGKGPSWGVPKNESCWNSGQVVRRILLGRDSGPRPEARLARERWQM